ncbi:PTS sugar transporter subunit IIA [Thermosediminibacter oceani]|uniref:PTS system fructose subfamily IIA component n=1 Tax=Thermosediminibacter oceani (strain ATCC BAA-1034 / DSM 16646 / JW/IW-1228P) TaxID=555079 RepID=D9RZ76_THEOJ|nr:PTS mannose transporter subunit IIAB [Thermosediminibacter oceani]ADL08630.1 PTS system fructose subfamily IIA component [Thermosediminibacter oceani DSM 16646]
MKEKAVLIITHGNFSRELLKSAELIMGEQKDVVTLGLNLGDDIESLRMDVEKIVVENQKANKETIILVDLFGGSTSNSALSVSKNYDVKILTGVNLPMLIEILSSRDKYDTEELIEIVYKSSVDGIKKLGSKL